MIASNQKVHSSYSLPKKAATFGTDPPTSDHRQAADKEAHTFTGDDAQVCFSVGADCNVIPWVFLGNIGTIDAPVGNTWLKLPTIAALTNVLYKFDAPKRALVFLETDAGSAPDGFITDQDKDR